MQLFKILTLALFAVALTSCKSAPPTWETWGAQKAKGRLGRKLDIRFAEGTEQHTLDVEGGKLSADILQVVNDQGRRKIVVKTRLRNATDGHVHFAMKDVHLIYGDEEFGAKGGLIHDWRPDVLPQATKSFSWAFEIGAVADTGIHELVIRNFMTTDGDLLFADQEFIIPVKVPGETLNFSQSAP